MDTILDTIRQCNDMRCASCLALTANYVCDLGRKTWNDCQTGLKQLIPCPIDDSEEYLIAHLHNI